MTAQIVMEGFLGTQYQIKPWIRKLITRSFAIVPALVCIAIYGAQGLNELLILSQIVLSLQLPFAVWPLIYFTSNREIMSVEYYDPNSSIDSKESFVNNNVEIITMCIIGLLLTIFNFVLLVEVVRGNT